MLKGNGLTYPNKNTILFTYLLQNEEISFAVLRKLRKYANKICKIQYLENEVKFLQNVLHYIQTSFLM